MKCLVEKRKHTNTLTRLEDEFLLQVVVSLFGHLVGGALLDLVLVQEAADFLDLPKQAMVVFIHQTLDPAARRAFRALSERERGRDKQRDGWWKK